MMNSMPLVASLLLLVLSAVVAGPTAAFAQTVYSGLTGASHTIDIDPATDAAGVVVKDSALTGTLTLNVVGGATISNLPVWIHDNSIGVFSTNVDWGSGSSLDFEFNTLSDNFVFNSAGNIEAGSRVNISYNDLPTSTSSNIFWPTVSFAAVTISHNTFGNVGLIISDVLWDQSTFTLQNNTFVSHVRFYMDLNHGYGESLVADNVFFTVEATAFMLVNTTFAWRRNRWLCSSTAVLLRFLDSEMSSDAIQIFDGNIFERTTDVLSGEQVQWAGAGHSMPSGTHTIFTNNSFLGSLQPTGHHCVGITLNGGDLTYDQDNVCRGRFRVYGNTAQSTLNVHINNSPELEHIDMYFAGVDLVNSVIKITNSIGTNWWRIRSTTDIVDTVVYIANTTWGTGTAAASSFKADSEFIRSSVTFLDCNTGISDFVFDAIVGFVESNFTMQNCVIDHVGSIEVYGTASYSNFTIRDNTFTASALAMFRNWEFSNFILQNNTFPPFGVSLLLNDQQLSHGTSESLIADNTFSYVSAIRFHLANTTLAWRRNHWLTNSTDVQLRFYICTMIAGATQIFDGNIFERTTNVLSGEQLSWSNGWSTKASGTHTIFTNNSFFGSLQPTGHHCVSVTLHGGDLTFDQDNVCRGRFYVYGSTAQSTLNVHINNSPELEYVEMHFAGVDLVNSVIKITNSIGTNLLRIRSTTDIVDTVVYIANTTWGTGTTAASYFKADSEFIRSSVTFLDCNTGISDFVFYAAVGFVESTFTMQNCVIDHVGSILVYATASYSDVTIRDNTFTASALEMDGNWEFSNFILQNNTFEASGLSVVLYQQLSHSTSEALIADNSFWVVYATTFHLMNTTLAWRRNHWLTASTATQLELNDCDMSVGAVQIFDGNIFERVNSADSGHQLYFYPAALKGPDTHTIMTNNSFRAGTGDVMLCVNIYLDGGDFTYDGDNVCNGQFYVHGEMADSTLNIHINHSPLLYYPYFTFTAAANIVNSVIKISNSVCDKQLFLSFAGEIVDSSIELTNTTWSATVAASTMATIKATAGFVRTNVSIDGCSSFDSLEISGPKTESNFIVSRSTVHRDLLFDGGDPQRTNLSLAFLTTTGGIHFEMDSLSPDCCIRVHNAHAYKVFLYVGISGVIAGTFRNFTFEMVNVTSIEALHYPYLMESCDGCTFRMDNVSLHGAVPTQFVNSTLTNSVHEMTRLVIPVAWTFDIDCVTSNFTFGESDHTAKFSYNAGLNGCIVDFTENTFRLFRSTGSLWQESTLVTFQSNLLLSGTGDPTDDNVKFINNDVQTGSRMKFWNNTFRDSTYACVQHDADGGFLADTVLELRNNTMELTGGPLLVYPLLVHNMQGGTLILDRTNRMNAGELEVKWTADAVDSLVEVNDDDTLAKVNLHRSTGGDNCKMVNTTINLLGSTVSHSVTLDYDVGFENTTIEATSLVSPSVAMASTAFVSDSNFTFSEVQVDTLSLAINGNTTRSTIVFFKNAISTTHNLMATSPWFVESTFQLLENEFPAATPVITHSHNFDRSDVLLRGNKNVAAFDLRYASVHWSAITVEDSALTTAWFETATGSTISMTRVDVPLTAGVSKAALHIGTQFEHSRFAVVSSTIAVEATADGVGARAFVVEAATATNSSVRFTDSAVTHTNVANTASTVTAFNLSGVAWSDITVELDNVTVSSASSQNDVFLSMNGLVCTACAVLIRHSTLDSTGAAHNVTVRFHDTSFLGLDFELRDILLRELSFTGTSALSDLSELLLSNVTGTEGTWVTFGPGATIQNSSVNVTLNSEFLPQAGGKETAFFVNGGDAVVGPDVAWHISSSRLLRSMRFTDVLSVNPPELHLSCNVVLHPHERVTPRNIVNWNVNMSHVHLHTHRQVPPFDLCSGTASLEVTLTETISSSETLEPFCGGRRESECRDLEGVCNVTSEGVCFSSRCNQQPNEGWCLQHGCDWRNSAGCWNPKDCVEMRDQLSCEMRLSCRWDDNGDVCYVDKTICAEFPERYVCAEGGCSYQHLAEPKCFKPIAASGLCRMVTHPAMCIYLGCLWFDDVSTCESWEITCEELPPSPQSCEYLPLCAYSYSLGRCESYDRIDFSRLTHTLVVSAKSTRASLPNDTFSVRFYGTEVALAARIIAIPLPPLNRVVHCPSPSEIAAMAATEVFHAQLFDRMNNASIVQDMRIPVEGNFTYCVRVNDTKVFGPFGRTEVELRPPIVSSCHTIGVDAFANNTFTLLLEGRDLDSEGATLLVPAGDFCPGFSNVSYAPSAASGSYLPIMQHDPINQRTAATGKTRLSGNFSVCYVNRVHLPVKCANNISVSAVAPWLNPVFVTEYTRPAPYVDGTRPLRFNAERCKTQSDFDLTFGIAIHPSGMPLLFGDGTNPYEGNEVCLLMSYPIKDKMNEGMGAMFLDIHYLSLEPTDELVVFAEDTDILMTPPSCAGFKLRRACVEDGCQWETTGQGTGECVARSSHIDGCPTEVPGHRLFRVLGSTAYNRKPRSYAVPKSGFMVFMCSSAYNEGGSIGTSLSYRFEETYCPNDCKDSLGTSRGSCVATLETHNFKCVCGVGYSGIDCSRRNTCKGTGVLADTLTAAARTEEIFMKADVCAYHVVVDPSLGDIPMRKWGLAVALLNVELAYADCDTSYIVIRELNFEGRIIKRFCKNDIVDALIAEKQPPRQGEMWRAIITNASSFYVEYAGEIGDRFVLDYRAMSTACPGQAGVDGTPQTQSEKCHGRGECKEVAAYETRALPDYFYACDCQSPYASTFVGKTCDSCGFGFMKTTFPICESAIFCAANCSGHGICIPNLGCMCESGWYGLECNLIDDGIRLEKLKDSLQIRTPLNARNAGNCLLSGGIDRTILRCALPGAQGRCRNITRARGRNFPLQEDVGPTFFTRTRRLSAPGTANDLARLVDVPHDEGLDLNSNVVEGQFPPDFIRMDNTTQVGGELTITAWVQATLETEGVLFAAVDSTFYPDGRHPALEKVVEAVSSRTATKSSLKLFSEESNVHLAVVLNGPEKRVDLLVSDWRHKGSATAEEDWMYVRHFRLGDTLLELFDGTWRHFAIEIYEKLHRLESRVFIDGYSKASDPDYVQCIPFLPQKSGFPPLNVSLLLNQGVTTVNPTISLVWGYRFVGAVDELTVFNKEVPQRGLIDIGGDEFLSALPIQNDAAIAILSICAICIFTALLPLGVWFLKRWRRRKEERAREEAASCAVDGRGDQRTKYQESQQLASPSVGMSHSCARESENTHVERSRPSIVTSVSQISVVHSDDVADSDSEVLYLPDEVPASSELGAGTGCKSKGSTGRLFEMNGEDDEGEECDELSVEENLRVLMRLGDLIDLQEQLTAGTITKDEAKEQEEMPSRKRTKIRKTGETSSSGGQSTSRNSAKSASVGASSVQVLGSVSATLSMPEMWTGTFGVMALLVSFDFFAATGVNFFGVFVALCSLAWILFAFALAVHLRTKAHTQADIIHEINVIIHDLEVRIREGGQMYSTKSPKITKIVTLLVGLLSVLYMPVTQQSFMILFCHPNIACIYDCYYEAEHITLMGIAGAALATISVMVPLFYLYVIHNSLTQYHTYIEVFDPKLHAEHWQMYSATITTPFSSLWNCVHHRHVYFEVIFLAFRAIMSGLAVGLGAETVEQLGAVVAVQVLFTIFCLMATPYTADATNNILSGSNLHTVAVLMLFSAYVLTLDPGIEIAMVVVSAVGLLCLFVAICYAGYDFALQFFRKRRMIAKHDDDDNVSTTNVEVQEGWAGCSGEEDHAALMGDTEELIEAPDRLVTLVKAFGSDDDQGPGEDDGAAADVHEGDKAE